MRSRVPSSSTRPSAPTCSTWRGQPAHRRRADHGVPRASRWSVPASSTPSMRSPADRPWYETAGWTSSRPTYWDGPCTSTPTRPRQRPVNLARHAFLNREKSQLFYPDWNLAADQIVAILRAEAGRHPYDKDLQDLIGELSTRSDEFRAKWGAHDVRRHATGVKHFHHSIVGDLDLLFESTDLEADPGWKLLIYTAEPGSPTADAVRLLASWAATQEQETAPTAHNTTTPNDA